ncbi:MAG: D-glycero-beta-D-manno-heptose 1,7-bisphosphate 7-phosphatase [Anaerolineae bacterium]|nr:D-glycero-beta-D-manno-heptose 1,7-bisphosphate 7-phosphatase [Anaerolineae bacterium]
MSNKTGAIFLDRDGVINENNEDHVKSWDEFQFIPHAIRTIRELTETGLPIFVVTNQGAVNRGIMSVNDLNDIHTRMLAAINEGGGKITKVYFCPHTPQEKCNCRKPEPGMLLQAAEEYNIDLSKSFMVGDAWTDMAAGREAGTYNILLLTGRGRWNVAPSWDRLGVDMSAACDVADAAYIIKEQLAGRPIITTDRFKSAFHTGLRPQEAWVF